MSTRLAEWAASERQSRPLLVTTRTRAEQSLWEPTLLGFLGFLVSLAVGAYLTLHLGIIMGDAIARVANAYYVLFSRDPHLAAIGFVWNPLPSFLELPLVALHGVWPALVTEGFAGNIVSSVFGGITAYFFNRILARLGISTLWRVLITLAFLANPMILFYSANGMSEIMMVGAMLGGIYGVLAYLDSRRLGALAAGAIWLATAFLIRYEAVPFALLLGLGMTVGLAQDRRPRPEVEGSLVLFGTPIAYTMSWWMYVNWLIMKNPLYFINSTYGNASQLSTGAYNSATISSTAHSLGASILYVAHFAFLFWPVILGLVVVLLSLLRPWRDIRAPGLLGALVAIPLLQIGLLYLNKSAGSNRFFIMYIPMGFILVSYAVGRLSPRLRTIASVAALVIFLLGDWSTLTNLQYGPLSNDFSAAVTSALQDRPVNTFGAYTPIARYFDRHPHMLVLADTFMMFPIVLRAHNPRQFVVTSDPDFQSILHYPLGRVNAILVPSPQGVGSLDSVNRAWPAMWQGKVPWAKLVPGFPGGGLVRLYTVTDLAP